MTRDLRELTIERLAAGGDGVGRDPDGRVTFVPRTALGDRVRVRLTEEKKRFARGELVELLEPGPTRVAPPCSLFEAGPCGGCQWQHVSAAGQAAAKQSLVADALRHAIEAGMELLPLASTTPALGWRRRARLHWVVRQRGRGALLGLYQPRSNHVVDLDACPQLEPALQGALEAVREHLLPHLRGSGELRMTAGEGGAVHVSVRGGLDPAGAAALVGRGGVVGVAAGRKRWGEPQIQLEPGLSGAASGFAQASRDGNAALLAAVDAATTPREGQVILELYAGAGNLTRVLRRGASRIVAVDVEVPAEPPAGEGARVSFRKGDVAEVVANLAEAGQRFGLAVLDPPRTGAAEVLTALAALRPTRVVYVSCDPATLGRDSERLRLAGYAPIRAQALDLMPQTSHVEVVMVMESRSVVLDP